MAQSAILSMFARSPIRPLQMHMTCARECAAELAVFFEAVLQNDWDQAQTTQLKINELERQADDMKHDLRMHLPKGLLLPVPRSDLLSLITHQDRIANTTKDVAGIVLGRKMQIPAAMTQRFLPFVIRCIDAVNQASKAIDELDELLESGFRGKEAAHVEQMIKKLDEIEYDTDTLQITVRRDLFGVEQELNPVDVIFLYDVIGKIGNIADMAEQTGSKLLILIAK